MNRLYLPSIGLIVLLLLTGCELVSSDEGPRTVGGVNIGELFEEPSSSELSAVRGDWAGRDVSAVNARVEQAATMSLSGTPATVRIVSHEVQGVKHFGAIITPDGLVSGEAPVVVYSHGGDNGVSVDGEVRFILSIFNEVVDRFVYVVPSFRDETLSFGGVDWTSDGPASPWDRDVDDALALLTVAGELEPAADMNSVTVLGLSRGAGVGMLMDVRDDRIDGVIEFFGPTDFFGPFVQDVTIETLEGNPRDLPGLDVLNERFLIPLADGTIGIGEVRTELVRRSPILFIDKLGDLQVHHGTADTTVPVTQAERLIDAVSETGRQAPEFEAFLYPGGEHNPLTLAESLDRAQVYLKRVLQQ